MSPVRLLPVLLLLAVSAARAQPAVFERCAACHAGKAAMDGAGPSLVGVVGRKAGSRDDFRYSRALQRSSIVWSEANLDAYLRAPDQFLPGTRMAFEGMASDAERKAVIEYLKTVK
jgi:cytochrome c2